MSHGPIGEWCLQAASAVTRGAGVATLTALSVFITAAALMGGLTRWVRVRVTARTRRGPYRDSRHPEFKTEWSWNAQVGAVWAIVSFVLVGLPVLLGDRAPGWIAILVSLGAPPAAFALARVSERYRESPFTPTGLALGWVAWAAMVAWIAVLERYQSGMAIALPTQVARLMVLSLIAGLISCVQCGLARTPSAHDP
jgi:hypothetical protein